MNGDNRNILCAIRGPIMLITVGVLFVINNFTPYGFQWPVLLIVFGLLTLIGRGARPVAPPPAQTWNRPAPAPPPVDRAASGGYRQSAYSQPAAGYLRENADVGISNPLLLVYLSCC